MINIKRLCIFFICMCLFNCTLLGRGKIRICPTDNRPKYRNPCELEFWENGQFRGYKSQNWKNYLDD